MSNKNNGASATGLLTPGRIAIAASAVAFVVYLMTMNRTFGFIDKGELAAVASTLGIPHPTGYPTIMLLGFLFTTLLPVREVLALNILAALLTAASVGVLTLLFNDLMVRLAAFPSASGDRKKGKEKPKGRTRDIENGVRALLAGFSALSLGFNSIWWGQSNGFEVYSLHAVFLPLIVLLFLRFCDSERTVAEEGGSSRAGFWFAFVVGLSFTNHLTTVLLAPSLLLYYIWSSRDHASGSGAAIVVRRLLRLVPPFLLGLLPYMWLPLRASMSPEFNWGNPSNLDRFIFHITGRQYQDLFNAGGDIFSQQTSYFFGGLLQGLGYVGPALVLFGIVHLLGRNIRLGVATLLLFVVGIIWAGNYYVGDVGSYYMAAILALGMLATAGLYGLYERVGKIAAVAAGVVVLILTVATNWSVSDESRYTMVEAMTRDVLENVPQNGLVLAGTWDNWVSGSLYMQGVEGVRPDVTVIVAEFLGFVWYLDQLEQNHPELMVAVKPQTDRFRKEQEKFEQGLPYDRDVLATSRRDILNAMVEGNIARRPLFIGPELREQIAGAYVAVPTHLLVRLAPDSTYLPEKFPGYHFTLHRGRVDQYVAELHMYYAQSAYERSMYERSHKNDTLASRYLDLAVSFDPGYRIEDIPSLPLEGEKYMREFIELFDKLRSARDRGGR